VARARPTNGDPNVWGTPEIVGTPVWVVAHCGGLSEVDGVDTDDDVEETEDGGASGLSLFMTGAEGFGISATEGGLRPALPISVAPMGMPTAPTGDPGVPAVAAAAAAPPPPIGAQGPDGLAVVPPPAALAPVPPPPALAPMPPPSNAALLEAPVVALVAAAAAAVDNAPPHATPVRGSSGDAPDMVGLTPGVASSVAPRGIRVGPTGAGAPMPSGDVMPKGNPGEMLGACACAAPQPTTATASAAASTIAKRVIMTSALFPRAFAHGPPGATRKANVIARREPHFAWIAAICPILRSLRTWRLSMAQRRSALEIELRLRLPAGGGDGRLEAHAPDDLLDLGVNPMRRRQMRRDPHAAGSVEIAAVEPPQRQGAAGEPLQEQRANMRFILGAAGQRDQVPGLDLARDQWLSIDEIDNRPQQKIDEHDESGGERGIGQIARSGEDADRRGAP
jgi:hypothetical protein